MNTSRNIIYHLFSIAVLTLSSFADYAQLNTDSLKQVICYGNDSEKIEAHIASASLFVDDSLSQALFHYNQAFQLSLKTKNLLKQASILERKGVAFDIHGQFENAVASFDSSLTLYTLHFPKDEGLVSLYLNYGVAYYFQEDFMQSLKMYLKGYELCKHQRESRNYSLLVNNIGNVYKKIKQYDEAIYFFKESVAVKKRLNNAEGVANSLLNIGSIYSSKTQTDSAVLYLQQAKDIYVALGNKRSTASVDIAMAESYYKSNDNKQAELLLKRWLEEDLPSLSNADRTAVYMLSIAISNESNKPHQVLKLAAEFERAFEGNISDSNMRELLYQKSMAYHQTGEHKRAYESLQQSYLLEKKYHEESNHQLMQEMQVRFSTEVKEREIELLQAEKKYADLLLSDSKKRNQYFIGGAILSALIAIVFWLQYRKIRKQKKDISESIEERSRLVAANSMLEGQEQERMRMAKDLHDGLGGLLSTVKSHFTMLAPEELKENHLYNKTNQLIDEACLEVRKISHDMMPHTLALSGIEGALEDIAFNLRSQNINCKLEVNTALSDMQESHVTMIYRIIQELVQNVRKHAESTELFIQLLENESSIHITVEDNGKGFEMNNANGNGGLGMSSIASRVKFLKGTIQYDSVVGTGTTVNIEIPKK